MSRRRRNIERHAGDYIYENLSSTVENLMDNRHRLLAPFPLEPDALYPYFWSEQELEALRVLSGKDGLLREGRELKLHMTMEGKQSGRPIIAVISTMTSEYQPVVKDALDTTKLPEHWQGQLREWVPLWMKLHHEKMKLSKKIKDVATVCKTYGQAIRLWPELEGFFPQYGRLKIQGAKVRSAIPSGAYAWYKDGDSSPQWLIQERFRPEALAPFAEMMAECLMLPKKEGTHLAHVTLRYL